MEFVTNFKNFLLHQKIPSSAVTVKNYKADIGQFIAWFESYFAKPFAPRHITPELIKTYQTIKLSGKSASSVKRHLSSLRKFSQYLKVQGLISVSPFEQPKNSDTESDHNKNTYHTDEFRNYLFSNNASSLTIKNYIMDIHQFMKWAHEVTGAMTMWDQLSPHLVEEYKNRLLERGLSPLSINRKLSSLRKYLGWLESEKLISLPVIPGSTRNLPKEILNQVQDDKERTIQETVSEHINSVQASILPTQETLSNDIAVNQYSRIPPMRLLQKIQKAANIMIDAALIVPLAKGAEVLLTAHSKTSPLFVAHRATLLSAALLPENIKKEFYAPLSVSTLAYPFHKKLLHHARHTRPSWYRKYHSYPVVHYFHFAVLVIFMTIIGASMYNDLFVAASKNQLLAAPVSPPRTLSFQGRLTDKTNAPITTSQSVNFRIYNDKTASGSALLWEESHTITPDSEGIFSVYLGSVTALAQSVFAENSETYLGIAIGTSEELSPRQQLATVAYATNAETLQGLAPITQTDAGTKNVVLALNSSGNLSIGGTASPTFEATGGDFTLSGNSVILTSSSTTGTIDTQKPLINSTTNNSVPGAVEVADMFSVSASATESAVTIDQLSTGPIFTASSSGAVKFQISNSGNVGIGTGASSDFAIMTQGSIGPSADATYDLGSSSKRYKSLYMSGVFNADGGLSISNTNPTLAFADSTTDEDDWNINIDTSSFQVRNTTDSANYFTIDGGGASTFTSSLTSGNFTTSGTTGITLSGSGGDITFANGEKFDNDTDGTIAITSPLISFSTTTAITASALTSFSIADNFILGLGTTTGRIEFDDQTIDEVNILSANVGIGSSAPLTKLHTLDNTTSGPLGITIENDGATTSNLLMFRLISEVGGTDNVKFSIDSDGDILTDGSTTIGTPADVAENYPVNDDSIVAGEILSATNEVKTVYKNDNGSITDIETISMLGRSSIPYDTRIVGIVSTRPGIVLSGYTKGKPIALSGRVPLKVTTHNGTIKSGDYLTSSSIPGVAMKATKTGPIVGMALESFTADGVGMVMTFVKPMWHDPQVYLTNAGDLNITKENSNFIVYDSTGDVVDRIGAFASAAIGNLKAGFINAQEITTSALTVNTQIVSPIANIDLVRTNIITPLSSTGITIKGNVEVKNTNGIAVATITTDGNASFSGQLTSNTLTTREATIAGLLTSNDASISGTLRARNVIADSIQGLDDRIATIAAGLLQPNNESGTMPAPRRTEGNQATSSATLLPNSLFHIHDSEAIDIASYSAQLAYVPNLQSDFAQITQGLTVLGPTSVTDVSVVGQVAIGGNFILSNSSINTLGSTLFIQPLKQGAISFMDDALFIDVTGSIKIKGDTDFAGNVTIKGNLAANIISPLADSDLVIQLGETTQNPNAEQSGNLVVKNASGSAVLSVNSLGDIIASGTATISKLNFPVSQAQALSFKESIATGSAGVSTIIANEPELTIKNSLVTEKSLIYITPVGTPSANIPFLLRQKPGESFSVGLQTPSFTDVLFNWLIIN